MNQEELIERIKLAFEKVHKKVGVFQTGELDEIFKEDETQEEMEEENKVKVMADPEEVDGIDNDDLITKDESKGGDNDDTTGNSSGKEGNKEDIGGKENE